MDAGWAAWEALAMRTLVLGSVQVILLATLLAGCAGAPTPTQPAPLPAPQPTSAPGTKEASTKETETPAPAAPTLAASASKSAPAPGQMTEEAALGKRLFDSERWAQALVVLRRVASGETGDDEGNKQSAEYHIAVALFRSNSADDSLVALTKLAENPNHLRHQEALLWLARLAEAGGPRGQRASTIIARNYREADAARFNNPQQQSLFRTLERAFGK